MLPAIYEGRQCINIYKQPQKPKPFPNANAYGIVSLHHLILSYCELVLLTINMGAMKRKEGLTAYMKLINVGFGNMVASDRIIAIVSPDSAPIKRLIQEAREQKRVVDATQGRRTRAVIISDSDHVVLSAIQPETISGRVHTRETISEEREG